jgi:hypothetical protein
MPDQKPGGDRDENGQERKPIGGGIGPDGVQHTAPCRGVSTDAAACQPSGKTGSRRAASRRSIVTPSAPDSRPQIPGGTVGTRAPVPRATSSSARAVRRSPLTDRERDVLAMIAEGSSNAQIAGALGPSLKRSRITCPRSGQAPGKPTARKPRSEPARAVPRSPGSSAGDSRHMQLGHPLVATSRPCNCGMDHLFGARRSLQDVAQFDRLPGTWIGPVNLFVQNKAGIHGHTFAGPLPLIYQHFYGMHAGLSGHPLRG